MISIENLSGGSNSSQPPVHTTGAETTGLVSGTALPTLTQPGGYADYDNVSTGPNALSFYGRSSYPASSIPPYGTESYIDPYVIPTSTGMHNQPYSMPTAPGSRPQGQEPYMPANYAQSWSSNRRQSTPVTAAYYGQENMLGYNTAGSPTYQRQVHHRGAPPSENTTSSLSLESLNSSLPTQPELRRLPAPNADPSDIRSNSRSGNYLTGFHSRSAMPWSSEASASVPRKSSTVYDLANASAMMQPMARPSTNSSPDDSDSPTDGGVLGYTFPEPNTPDITMSSNTGNYYSGAPLPPVTTTVLPSSFRMYSSVSSASSLPTTASSQDPSIVRNTSDADLYSWSAEPRRDSLATSSGDDSASLVSGQSYTPLRQPQPQRATDIETLRRESVQQQQQQQHQRTISHRNSNPNNRF